MGKRKMGVWVTIETDPDKFPATVTKAVVRYPTSLHEIDELLGAISGVLARNGYKDEGRIVAYLD